MTTGLYIPFLKYLWLMILLLIAVHLGLKVPWKEALAWIFKLEK
jgi:hypothetical protein